MRRLRIPILICIFVLSAFSSALPVMPQTSTIQQPNPVTKAFALNQPAVFLIHGIYNATFSFPSATFQVDNQGNFQFSPNTAKMVTLPVGRSDRYGSGFAITPDGYIVTNAHVATSQLARYTFLTSVVTTTLQYQLQLGTVPSQFSQNFQTAFYNYLQTNGKFSSEINLILVGLPVPGANGNLTAQWIPASVSIAGDMIGTGTERDVAIIKISANRPLHTVQLGDSNSVSPGDTVAIIGYPGFVAPTQNIAGEESLIPTVTAGIVSALKPVPEGWTAIQTDATVVAGDSGGPALDANGNVIGIATFAGANPSSGSALAGINFLVPINIAKQYAGQISVQNTRGQLDQYWQQALQYFWGHHYSAAIQQFNAVLSLYPNDLYATQYIQQANAQIRSGNDIPISASTISATASTSAPIAGSNFAMSLSPATISLVQGSQGTASLSLQSTGASINTVQFTTGNLPSGVSVEFDPNPAILQPGRSITVNVKVTVRAGMASGTYSIPITATVGSVSKQATITLQVSGCLIATATFGSELSPEVQFLREFRDHKIMKTFAGSSFIAAFNSWYYSFSPYVANYENNNEPVRAIMMVILYPLIGVLKIGASMFGIFPINAEVDAFISGLMISLLLGATYAALPLTGLLFMSGRSRRIAQVIGRPTSHLLLAALGIALFSEITHASAIMTIVSATVVLSTILGSALLTSHQLLKLCRRY